MARRLHRGRRHRGRTERGYVLVTSALVLVPLLLVSGMALDFGGNYWYGAKMQRAADSAALAGVIWLPDLAKARAVAREMLDKNGWPDDAEHTATITQVSLRRLQVVLTGPATWFLAGKILDTSATITRSGTAEYLQPVPMGSPIASLANDPESSAPPPQIWLNQSGPGSTKGNGDEFSSGVCGVSGSGFNSGCSAASNTELSDNGYSYITRVTSVGSGPLRFQAFDPAFIYTGDTCDVNGYSATEEVTLIGQYSASDPRAADRYRYTNKAFCPGDQAINGRADVTTTFIVRSPDTTPFDPLDNPAICAISFSPYTSGYFAMLDKRGPMWNVPQGAENLPFASIFRRWVDICTVSTPVVGDYVTQVTTTADQSNPYVSTTGRLGAPTGAGSLERRDPAIRTGGHNRYALRSGFGPSVNGVGVAEFAAGRLPLYVNQNTSSATFFLTQLQPAYAGATLELSFFDIADTAGDATMTVKPPADSNYASSGFPDCRFVRDGTAPDEVTSSGCSVSGLTRSGYDSRVVTLTLVMPNDYTCAASSPMGCWLTVDLDFSGAPTDTTTWSASLIGDPVRLVE